MVKRKTQGQSRRPPHRIRGGGPRGEEDEDGVEWRLVKVRRDRQRGRGPVQSRGEERGGRRVARPRDGDNV